ncbi:MAG TPA: hypothetical protein VL382_06245 [Terriglobales bacterium]|nr:hypothetical protein [Terriglobales bacterium]
MTRRWLALFAFISVLALCTPSLMADSDKGKGKGQSHGASKDKDKSHDSDMQDNDADQGKHKDKDKDKHKGKDKDKDKDKDWDRDEAWEHRGGYEYRTYGANDNRPPGWSRGNKTGWGNCDVPPGQAKKGSCRTYIHQGHRYYYYYDDHDRMVLRRHVIQQR